MPVDDIRVGPPAASRADRRRARAALVLGVLPLPPLWLGAVPLAVRTMRRVPSGSSTFAVAVAAMSAVFGWMYVTFMVLVLAAAWFAPTDPVATDRVAGAPGSVHPVELQVGDCFVDGTARTEYTSVDVVSCAEPHHEQVYAVHELPDAGFPGEAELAEQVEEHCDASMPARVRDGLVAGELEISWFAPDSRSSYDDDRLVICLAGTDDTRSGTLLGSVV